VSAPFCKKLCAFFGEKEGDWKGMGREWEGIQKKKGWKGHPWQVVSLTPTSGQVSHRIPFTNTIAITQTEGHVELMYACARLCVCVACPAGVINL